MADNLVTGSDGLGGPPGDRWTNRTDRVWWQWVCAMRKPCARCLRRDGRLFPGPDPPEKLHPHCECTWVAVRPGGQAALPFRSVPEAVAELPVGDQVHLVGALCWLIQSAGLVTWYDLFDGNGDPREFDQVVWRKGLTVPQLVQAGIAEGVARRAVGLGPLGK
jgi:hypothetical protein